MSKPPKAPDLNDLKKAGKMVDPFDESKIVRLYPKAAASLPPKSTPPSGAPKSEDAAPKVKGKRGPSKFTRLVRVAEQWPLFRTPTGLVYVEIDGRALPVDGQAFASRLTREIYDASGNALSEGEIKALVRLLRARVTRIEPASVRVAEHSDAWWLDLGTDDTRVVRITPGLLTIEAKAPIAFARPSGSMALPELVFPRNQREATKAIRRALQAVGCSTNRAAVSVFAWWCSVLRPSAPYAILILRGAAGSGKSMAATYAARFLDPRRPNLQRFPALEDLPLLAENSHTIGFDNLSKVSQAESDALCCLSTGDAMQKRALYTGRDLETFEAAKPCVLTSVVDAATAGDLLDRALVVTLGIRTTRSTTEELEQRFLDVHAAGAGAMLWIVAQARKAVSSVNPPSSVRLRAVAALAAAGEGMAGFEAGAVFAAFDATQEDAAEVASDHPLAGPLVALTKRQSGHRWEGTTEELGSDLREHHRDAPLPKTPQALRSAIQRLEPTFPALGLHLERRRTNVRRELVFTYREPTLKMGALDAWLEESFEP